MRYGGAREAGGLVSPHDGDNRGLPIHYQPVSPLRNSSTGGDGAVSYNFWGIASRLVRRHRRSGPLFICKRRHNLHVRGPLFERCKPAIYR